MNKYILLIVLLFLVSGRIAAQSVTVDAKIDSLQILIGEQAKVQLQVAMDAKQRAVFRHLQIHWYVVWKLWILLNPIHNI